MTDSDADALRRRRASERKVDPLSAARRWLAAVILVVGGCMACASASAQTAASAAGEAAWDKAGCLQCHGANGEGGSGGEFPAGPSLRETRLDRASLVEAITCGLPGTPMPAWLDGAYTRRVCYGFPLGPAPAEITAMPVLSPDEVEALVDFLGARFIGH